MDKQLRNNEAKKKEKWVFEDYAFTIATILFFVFILLPYKEHILTDPGNLGDAISATMRAIEFNGSGIDPMNIYHWQPYSWMFFLLAWLACEVKSIVDAKRGKKSTEGKLETCLDDALYLGITIVMLFIGIITGNKYASWLAGPITFVLYTVVWPVLRNSDEDEKRQTRSTMVLLAILGAGIIIEVAAGGWVAFPVSWIIICIIKTYRTIRKSIHTEEDIFNIVYYVLSVVFISIGVIKGFWITSWLALPVASIISKVASKIEGRKIKHQA